MLIEISKRLLKDNITYAKSLFKATKEIDDAPSIEMSHVKPWPWIYSFSLQCFYWWCLNSSVLYILFYQFEKIKSAQLDCFIALVTVLFYGTVSCPFSMMMQCLQNAMQCTTCGYFQSEGPPLASPSSLKHLVGVALWNWAEKSTPNLFRKSKWDLFPSIVQGT